MEFVKMHGLGNDFIILDDTDHRQKNGREGFETEKHCCEESELSPELVRHFCDRHRGIGADGVIRVCNAEHPQADFRMKLYNADGSQARMCGNGIRCLGKYVYDHGKTEKVNLLIETDAGLYRLQLIKKEETDRICSVRVDMGTPDFVPEHISARFLLFRPVCVSMGNPHAVVWVNSVKRMDLAQIGPEFEYHGRFPRRVNVEFAQVVDREHIIVRVWERGAGETLACGTGACAVAAAGVLNDLTERHVTVKLKGGELSVLWDEADGKMYMTGPAVSVYDGIVTV